MKSTQIILVSLVCGFSSFVQATPLIPVANIKKYDSPIHTLAQSKDRESHLSLHKSAKSTDKNRAMAQLLSSNQSPTAAQKVNSFFKSLFS